MGGNKADMRITSIRREDATVPNALIQSCHDSQSKRRTLAQLQRAWNRYNRRLAMYDSNDDVIGIAFADSDGNIKSVVSPHDLSKAIPVIERYVKGTIKQHRLRRQDTSQFGNVTRDDTTDASMQRDYADVFGNVGHDGTSSVSPDDDEIDADYDMPEAEPSNGTTAGVKTHDTMKPRRKRHHAIGIVILLVILAVLGLSVACVFGYIGVRVLFSPVLEESRRVAKTIGCVHDDDHQYTTDDTGVLADLTVMAFVPDDKEDGEKDSDIVNIPFDSDNDDADDSEDTKGE